MRKLISDMKLAWKLAVALFLTALRVRRARRKMMFYVSLVAMLFAFSGFTFLDGFLTDHPLLFAIYWFFCIGLVLLMFLLALYDFAAVKGELNAGSNEDLAKALKQIEESARANKGKAEEDND